MDMMVDTSPKASPTTKQIYYSIIYTYMTNHFMGKVLLSIHLFLLLLLKQSAVGKNKRFSLKPLSLFRWCAEIFPCVEKLKLSQIRLLSSF